MSTLTPAQQRIHDAALRLFAQRGVVQINVKELAQEAGVARGTIYNNLPDPEGLFEAVATQLAEDMIRRAVESFEGVTDPAERLAIGVRLHVRRAHEEPDWGRFMTRFAFSVESLQQVWRGQPYVDLMNGLQSGRYHFRQEQAVSALGMLAGTVLSAMFMVLEGLKTWREAGSDAAEMILVGLGVARAEARELASAPLPSLHPRQRH